MFSAVVVCIVGLCVMFVCVMVCVFDVGCVGLCTLCVYLCWFACFTLVLSICVFDGCICVGLFVCCLFW